MLSSLMMYRHPLRVTPLAMVIVCAPFSRKQYRACDEAFQPQRLVVVDLPRDLCDNLAKLLLNFAHIFTSNRCNTVRRLDDLPVYQVPASCMTFTT